MNDHEEPGAATSAAPGAADDWLSAWFAQRLSTGRFGTREGEAWTRNAEHSHLDAALVGALNANKLSGVIHVPFELVNPPDSVPPTWRTRFRWKRAEWREQAARRAYRLIAGDWPPGDPDW